ncbi:MAG: IS5 family transposase [Desulfosarcinaceae bacterium]|nr:IS5 family transposase [Desulfosarcinaceae bacterium]
MYRHNLKQLELVEFSLPFEGRLSPDNKWIKLSRLIPWEQFEESYQENFSDSGVGNPALSVRMALAALIIKEDLGLSDRDCVEQITENPYLQYFCGLKAFITEAPFDPSMYVHFRKRFPADVVQHVNDVVADKIREAQPPPDDPEDPQPPSANDKKGSETGAPPANQGKLLVDATCAPADITYPTDLKLLNTSREKSEEIIDELHKARGPGHKKPRTYRQRARRQFLSAAKSKRLSRKKLRKCRRQQLGYLRRNLKSIGKLAEQVDLTVLDRRQYKNLLVISEVLRQQTWMHENNARRIDDRIVSISQPHVRPIKRGKAGSDTEFGAKLSISLIDGVSFVDRISWSNYNEGLDLIGQIEFYRMRFGCYPESVHADKIYRNRTNRRYCKKHHIRLSGPKLGRPPKITEADAERIKAQKQQARQDEIDRNAVEGKFGQGKRRYSLNRIMTKLSGTSETAIMLSFLVMNLKRWLATLFFSFLREQMQALRSVRYALLGVAHS